MTVLDLPKSDEFSPPDVTWSTPQPDLWVATANGQFAGQIQFSLGHFIITNADGAYMATATSIPAAKQEFLADPALPRTRTTTSMMTFASSFFARRTPQTDYRRSFTNS